MGLAFIAVCAGLGCGAYAWAFSISKKTIIADTGPTIIRVEKLSELSTLKVTFGKLITIKDVNRWGTVEGKWAIQGDALISVDMSKARIANVDAAARKVRLWLPRPRAIQPRVNHERTQEYDLSIDLFRSGDTANEMRAEALRKGQEYIEEDANSAEYIDLSRERVESSLGQMFAYIGWELECQWEDRPAK